MDFRTKRLIAFEEGEKRYCKFESDIWEIAWPHLTEAAVPSIMFACFNFKEKAGKQISFFESSYVLNGPLTYG